MRSKRIPNKTARATLVRGPDKNMYLSLKDQEKEQFHTVELTPEQLAEVEKLFDRLYEIHYNSVPCSMASILSRHYAKYGTLDEIHDEPKV